MTQLDIQKWIDQTWDQSILPKLMEYIHIPNKSPLFDPDWKAHGHMDRAVKLMTTWCEDQNIPGLKLSVLEYERRTPVIFIEIPGQSDETLLMYGHLDKQPEMVGWDSDLAPWKPVIKEDKLYGRGGADDGYAIFSAITAVKALQTHHIPHGRILILIEACEESGSYDLPFYIENLQNRIGIPSLIICLDSGCGNYEQLWMTTSLRGLVGGILRIEVLTQGIHSGLGSGIVPSCFMVLRQLLDRIEDNTNGEILLKDLSVEIPDQRLHQAELAASVLNKAIFDNYPFVDGVKTISNNLTELLLNRTWRPALSITGINGIPIIGNAGNVTLPSIDFKLSMRIPPTCDKDRAAKALKTALESSPPFHAKIIFDTQDIGPGWNAPLESPWLKKAALDASMKYFGKEAVYMGEGGSIPFMGMLSEKFPKADFLVTGLLGPRSNAHGPNEFLHIPYAKKLTCCVSEIIAVHYEHFSAGK